MAPIHAGIRYSLRMTLFSTSKPSYGSSSCFLLRGMAFPRLRFLHPRALPLNFPFRSFCSGRSEDFYAFKVPEKPSVCTADELHYVSAANSGWRLALWRYLPPPNAPSRNHPLLLLSGVGTNAIAYDLSPGSSFARYMSDKGFETWILEVRGSGLSTLESSLKDVQKSAFEASDQMEAAGLSTRESSLKDVQKSAIEASDEMETAGKKNTEKEATSSDENKTTITNATATSEHSALTEVSMGVAESYDESKLAMKLTDCFMHLSERLSGYLGDGQSNFLSAKLFDQIEHLSSTIEDFHKQLDLIMKYDWDFDHYLEEDVPAAIEYIIAQSMPKDGKLFAIGHSMGGILLYAMLSRCAFEGKESNLTAIVTIASSVDYTTSDSRLKLLLPLADPAKAMNLPVVPLGTMLAAAYPLSSRAPQGLSWITDMITAANMMHPELSEKLILNSFCTIPAKLLIQLTTAFKDGGLRDRGGKFSYKDHLPKTKVPILALAGDMDFICPPEAVEETVKLLPEEAVAYKVFGEPEGPHYAHYDLLGGLKAADQVYPCITEFLTRYD